MSSVTGANQPTEHKSSHVVTLPDAVDALWLGWGGLREAVQNHTLWPWPTGAGDVAGLHEGDETSLERLQFTHFGSNRGKVFGSHVARVHAGVLQVVHERTNLLD
jgi:hypothetical protein